MFSLKSLYATVLLAITFPLCATETPSSGSISSISSSESSFLTVIIQNFCDMNLGGTVFSVLNGLQYHYSPWPGSNRDGEVKLEPSSQGNAYFQFANDATITDVNYPMIQVSFQMGSALAEILMDKTASPDASRPPVPFYIQYYDATTSNVLQTLNGCPGSCTAGKSGTPSCTSPQDPSSSKLACDSKAVPVGDPTQHPPIGLLIRYCP